MTVNEIVCSNIAELRKGQGLSQEGLAGMLGVTFQAVSKWENQLSCPDISLIPKIAEIFQVSIDFLFGKEDEKEKFGKEKFRKEEFRKEEKERQIEWPDDENLYAVVFQGHRMLQKEEITKGLSEIELKYDGDMQGMSITSCFSISVAGDISGSNIQSGTHITCSDVADSNINAGANITCSDIANSGIINAGTHITAADITECDTICSGAHITAVDIQCTTINAGTHINAANIAEEEE